MNKNFKYVSALLAFMIAIYGNLCPVYRILDDSVRATLYLDIVDHDEDLFVHVVDEANDQQQTLIHHEESNRDAGTKSKLLKRKFHLFLSFSKFGHGEVIEFNHLAFSSIPAMQEVQFSIFHPPNYSV